ncbi:MAG: DNA polymerase III subunit chi [Candidatus Puniceispirillum sp.]|nr:DNA polymerase III subunit chi [Candidatus Puniceispirillum sp.]
MEVRFYHLEKTPLEKGCAKLLERVLDSGERAVLHMGDPERLAHLNTVLWTYASAAFLPHGTSKEGSPDKQPIWLTTDFDNPNGASVILLCDGQVLPEGTSFTRCLDLFDASDDSARMEARDRWRVYKERGYHLAYWKQNAQGVWEVPTSPGATVR